MYVFLRVIPAGRLGVHPEVMSRCNASINEIKIKRKSLKLVHRYKIQLTE